MVTSQKWSGLPYTDQSIYIYRHIYRHTIILIIQLWFLIEISMQFKQVHHLYRMPNASNLMFINVKRARPLASSP